MEPERGPMTLVFSPFVVCLRVAAVSFRRLFQRRRTTADCVRALRCHNVRQNAVLPFLQPTRRPPYAFRNLAPPICSPRAGLRNLVTYVASLSIFNETNYLRMHWTGLHQVFTIGRLIREWICGCSTDVAVATNFGANRWKQAYPTQLVSNNDIIEYISSLVSKGDL